MESTTIQSNENGLSPRTLASIWLLTGPTVLLVVVSLLVAILNMVFNPTMWMRADTEPYAATPLGFTVANVLLFGIGSLALIAWLPALITGIILIATRKK